MWPEKVTSSWMSPATTTADTILRARRSITCASSTPSGLGRLLLECQCCRAASPYHGRPAKRRAISCSRRSWRSVDTAVPGCRTFGAGRGGIAPQLHHGLRASTWPAGREVSSPRTPSSGTTGRRRPLGHNKRPLGVEGPWHGRGGQGQQRPGWPGSGPAPGPPGCRWPWSWHLLACPGRGWHRASGRWRSGRAGGRRGGAARCAGPWAGGLTLGAQVDRPALQQRAKVEIGHADILAESAALCWAAGDLLRFRRWNGVSAAHTGSATRGSRAASGCARGGGAWTASSTRSAGCARG